MKQDKIFTISLTFFIFVAAVFFAWDNLKSSESSVKKETKAQDELVIPKKGEFVQVFYFHSKARCSVCHTIENYTKEYVDTSFKDKLKAQEMGFASFNYQEDKNKNYVKTFGIYMSTVVVAKYYDGELKTWKSLDKVWEFFDNKESFDKYLAEEFMKVIKG
ncbi:MAG: nitrophenyl compound nitroreductase subunit ArsF family protein [Alphaproteobacteria bacterium]